VYIDLNTSALPSLSPLGGYDSPRSYPPLESPTASTFLRTAETLDGLAKQLEILKDVSDGGGEVRCPCGAKVKEREKMEDKLKLSGGRISSPFV